MLDVVFVKKDVLFYLFMIIGIHAYRKKNMDAVEFYFALAFLMRMWYNALYKRIINSINCSNDNVKVSRWVEVKELPGGPVLMKEFGENSPKDKPLRE